MLKQLNQLQQYLKVNHKVYAHEELKIKEQDGTDNSL